MKMNILVTLDSGYIKPLTVMLNSVAVSNPANTFDIYVAHASLTTEDFQYLAERVPGDRIRIHSIPIAPQMFEDAPVDDRIPKATYYRLLAAQFLPETLDRVLYLDPDLVVINPLNDFYSMNLDEKYFAAASHQFNLMQWINRVRLKLPRGAQYINAGVMLMNLELLRSEQDVHAIYDYIRIHRGHLPLKDQDIINGMYASKTAYVDALYYNLDETYWHNHNRFNRSRRVKTIDEIEKITVIVHYCGKNKPWKEDYRGELDRFYNSLLDCVEEPAVLPSRTFGTAAV